MSKYYFVHYEDGDLILPSLWSSMRYATSVINPRLVSVGIGGWKNMEEMTLKPKSLILYLPTLMTCFLLFMVEYMY